MQRLLVTVTGPDRPGLTASLAALVAESGAELLDVEQVSVQGALTLSLVLGMDPAASPAILQELVAAGRTLGVSVGFSFENEAAEPARDRFVVTIVGDRLSARHLHVVSQRLAEHDAHVDRIQRLTDEHLAALDLLCSLPAGAPPAALKRGLLDLSTTHGIDIAFQRDDVYRRSKRLVCMDMDSTLIRIEVIDELARIAGVGEQVSEITRRAMNGEMDYDESLRQRVALLAGLDAQVLDQIAANLPLSDGAETLVRVLRRLGFKTAVISGGFDLPARALQAKLGLDYAYSNVLEVRDGRLTGRVSGEIVNARRKAELLEDIAKAEGIALDQTVAIGDGANDLLMLQKAGLGIAFHAKPRLREAAHTAMTGGLERTLYLLGLRARDVRALAK